MDWNEFWKILMGITDKPLQFMEKVADYVIDELIGAIKGALSKIWYYATAPFRAVIHYLIPSKDVLHTLTLVIKDPSKCPCHIHDSIIISIYCSIHSIAGPLTPVFFIAIFGMLTAGIIWALKRLYELL